MRVILGKSFCLADKPFSVVTSSTVNLRLWRVGFILANTSGEVLELFTFDEAYVVRLREGDPSTESHFIDYFSRLIQIKLRARHLPPAIVDDLKQETFVPGVKTLRSQSGIHHPDRLGPFVNSVCNN